MQQVQTPWGVADGHREIADGIVSYTTPGHGGVRLSPDRVREFCRLFPDFKTFCGKPQWFEEDCDAAAIVLAFPEHFSDHAIHDAWEMAQSCAKSWAGQAESPGWAHVVDVVKQARPDLIARAREFADQNKGLWRYGGMSSGDHPKLWDVNFYRGEDRRTVAMAYPQKEYYSDDELAALEAEAKQAV